ncbi:MAG TPA: hypothetical protein VIV60_06595 [Polyangiaceae bacterium]
MFGNSVLDVHTSDGWFELKYVEYSLGAKGWQWSSQTVWGETWSILRVQLERVDWLEYPEIQRLYYDLTERWISLDGTTTISP